MTTSDKIYIEGVEYTIEELDRYCNELLNPTTPVVQPEINLQIGKGLQFVKDENLYKEIVKYMNKTFPNSKEVLFGKLKFEDNVMKGSNPCIATAVDMFLKSINSKSRIATQRDLETNLEMFRGTYEDTGLVLRTKQEPNPYLAENLFNQFKKQGKNIKENSAYVLEFRNLFLKEDSNSPLGLSFILPSLYSNYFEAPILNELSQQKFEFSDIERKTCLPKKVSSAGTRILYTRNWEDYSIKNSGLVRLYLYWNLDLNSSDKSLSISNDYGRVVLVSSEGGAF